MTATESTELYPVASRPVDERDRVVVNALSDTEMLREILVLLRGLQDTVNDFDINDMFGKIAEQNPMLKALFPG